MRECVVIALMRREIGLLEAMQVADLSLEIQTDEASSETLTCVSGRKLGLAWVQLYSPVPWASHFSIVNEQTTPRKAKRAVAEKLVV